MRKPGFTLIELVVSIAIIAVLFGLTVAAVQNVREASLRLKSMNNLRQISLALQNYATTHDQLPTIVDVMAPNVDDRGPFFAILPMIEHNRSLFLSPADPSLEFVHPHRLFYPGLDPNDAYASYAYNALVFTGRRQRLESIRDGTSNTIGLAEHYARCAERKWMVFIFSLHFSFGDGGPRRPSFADRYYGDVYPITLPGEPPLTVPSLAGATFQVRPSLLESDATMPQTPHAGGMLVAMMDGSVRTMNRGVNVSVFWGAVTPSSGDL